MKRMNFLATTIVQIILIPVFLAPFTSKAQPITVYQYRWVAPDKAEEFVKRETTYWSKVAKKALDNGKMEFWALFEKVGGDNLQNSANYLFINSFKDIDVNMGEIFNPKALFPGIALDKMETGAISKTTAEYFLRDEGWEQAAKVVHDKDFKYVVFYYHNTSNPDSFVTLEKKYWGPFIKSSMDKNLTSQRGWGNAVVLTPVGNDMKFNSISFDLYPTLKDALMPRWDSTVTFPASGMTELNKLRLNPPSRDVYRIVKVVSKN
jgi:hypothetical protein